MDRPLDLFDREHEWRDLADFATAPGAGIQLALVRGRRRQGKSYLLRRLVRATGGFYHQAVQEEQEQALAGLGEALADHHGIPGSRLALANWASAVAALTDLARPATHAATGQGGPADRPVLVVLDELPYLIAHSPELPSVLQRAIDRSRDGGPPVRLVLCGSAISAMASLLTGSQALRGRARLDVMVREFDYRTSARFWGISDPTTAFTVNAIVGGTPGYRDLLPGAPPSRPADVPRWLAAGPLNPASALFREDELLLAEDGSLPDRGLYHAVIAAIANGATSQGAIAAAVGREQRGIQHPLRSLVDAGFVIRTDDALRDRRPVYQLADPIVRFHHVVTRRDLARFEDRRTDEAWAAARTRFATHVLGPRFEAVAREFTLRYAAPETVGGPLTSVGPAVVSDAAERIGHELDVVGLGRRDDGAELVRCLGEAKHTTARRTPADLDRLDRIRSLVAQRHPSAAEARLLLFSASGFDRSLRAAASRRGDVELVDIDRLYGGS